MRRTLAAFGLLLLLAGFAVANIGVQIFVPFAEPLGLAYQVPTERKIVGPELVNVAPSNYTFTTVDLVGGVQVRGSLEVEGGREIGFYVMDQDAFAQWRAGRNTTVTLAKPFVISANFTLIPPVTGTYYFVFDNQDTSRRIVLLNLSLVDNVTVLSPALAYAEYELFALGAVLFALGVKTGRKKTKVQAVVETGVNCKFCSAKLESGQTFCGKCGRAQS